jgi:hypothetical protein
MTVVRFVFIIFLLKISFYASQTPLFPLSSSLHPSFHVEDQNENFLFSFHTIRSFKFQLKTHRSCRVIKFDEMGSLENITLILKMPPDDHQTHVSLQITSDLRKCLSYSTTNSFEERTQCEEICHRDIIWINKNNQQFFQDAFIQNLQLKNELEICMQSPVWIEGEILIGLRNSPSSTVIDSNNFEVSQQTTSVSFEKPPPSSLSGAVFVTNPIDSSPNISSCDPNDNQNYSGCNLRSAFAYCNHTLSSSSNLTCVIEIIPHSQLLMNSSLGSIVVSASSGELSVLGNGCEISSLTFDTPSTFLTIEPHPPLLQSLHFLFENATVRGFGNKAQSGGGFRIRKIESLHLRQIMFLSNDGEKGGGLYATDVNYVRLDDCYFESNSAKLGGGAYLENILITGIDLSRCVLLNNTSVEYGGGIAFAQNNENIRIVDTTFMSNFGRTAGGALAFDWKNTNIQILNSTFSDNVATRSKRNEVTVGVGGAIIFWDDNKNIEISSSTFDGNNAGLSGAIEFFGINSNISISNCVFRNQTADYDATVLSMSGSNISIVDCVFTDNHPPRLLQGGRGPSGVIIFSQTFDSILANCLFDQNSLYSIYLTDLNKDFSFLGNSFTGTPGLYFGNTNSGFIKNSIFRDCSSSVGGAIELHGSGSISIVDCEFIGNEAEIGGAIFVNTITPMEVTNCTFIDNEAFQSGGAVYLADYSSVTFENCFFVSNHGFYSGGAIYMAKQGSVSIMNTTFESNLSDFEAGGAIAGLSDNDFMISFCTFLRNRAYLGAGAINFQQSHWSIQVKDSIFKFNQATYGAGAIFFGEENLNILIERTEFLENSGYAGGAVAFQTFNQLIQMIDLVFTANSALFEGGGVHFDSSNNDLIMSNCLFLSNTAQQGGAVSLFSRNTQMSLTNCVFEKNVAAEMGGGLLGLAGNEMLIVSCSFAHNDAGDGGGVFIYSNNKVSITNTDFQNNTAESKGGGLYLAFQNTNIVFRTLFFQGNIATEGGGIYIQSGNDQMLLVSSIFSWNSAVGSGGALYVQDSNPHFTVLNCEFNFNVALKDGGAILLQSSNTNFLINASTFRGNTAASSGGSVHSSLMNDEITISNSTFMDSSGVYGGCVYFGSDHTTITISSSSFLGSIGDYGGALFVSAFTDLLLVNDSTILDCFGSSGNGALTSFADVTRVQNSRFLGTSSLHGIVEIAGDEVHVSGCLFVNNTSEQSTGPLVVSEASTLILSNSRFERNVGYEGGALTLYNIFEIQISDCVFLRNRGYSGGAMITSIEQFEMFRTVFDSNIANFNGGSLYMNDVTYFNFTDVSHLSSQSGLSGTLIMFGVTGLISRNIFSKNLAKSGGGSALYTGSSLLQLTDNTFIDNVAINGGGVVYWSFFSEMSEPEGLTTLNTFINNSAPYGPKWATDPCQLLTDKSEYYIVDYGIPVQPILVTALDYYSQAVTTLSATEVSVSVGSSLSCYDAPGYTTGGVTESFQKGVANFSSLQVYCAPGYSLTLEFRATLTGVVITSTTLTFRNCSRGEYYSAQECVSCELGTYSLSSDTSDLSKMNQISVCKPCPAHTISCEGDVLELEKGYWRISTNSDSIQVCPYGQSACLGGTAAGDDSCEKGYEGPLCAVCSSGYALQSSTRTCVPCSESSGFDISDIIFLVVAVLLLVVVVSYFCRPEIRAQIKSMDDFVLFVITKLRIVEIKETSDRKAIVLFAKTLSRRLRARLKVYVTMYQILSTLPFVLDLTFPSPVSVFISALNFINISIAGSSIVSCSAYSYDFIDSLLASTIYPIVVVALLFTIRWIHIRIIRLRWKRQRAACEDAGGEPQSPSPAHGHEVDNHISNVSSTYFLIFLVFTYLILPSVSTKIFQTFR